MNSKGNICKFLVCFCKQIQLFNHLFICKCGLYAPYNTKTSNGTKTSKITYLEYLFSRFDFFKGQIPIQF